jgi:hypothetical protein
MVQKWNDNQISVIEDCKGIRNDDSIPLDEEQGASPLYLRSCTAAVSLPLQPFGCKDLRFPILVHHTPRNHNDMRYSSIFQTTNFEDVDPRGKNREYPTFSLQTVTQSEMMKEQLRLEVKKHTFGGFKSIFSFLTLLPPDSFTSFTTALLLRAEPNLIDNVAFDDRSDHQSIGSDSHIICSRYSPLLFSEEAPLSVEVANCLTEKK